MPLEFNTEITQKVTQINKHHIYINDAKHNAFSPRYHYQR